MCTSCTNQAHYSLVCMCTPCSKPHPPPNWRSRSRVVASYHVLIGSGTGAVHTHGPHIRMSIFHTHLCATSPSCSVTNPSVTQSYLTNDTFFAASHTIYITLHILPCWHLSNTRHCLSSATSLEKMSTCKTVESYLSRTSSNFLLSEHLKLTTPTLPLSLVLMYTVPLYSDGVIGNYDVVHS